jgi:hypothetical protein
VVLRVESSNQSAGGAKTPLQLASVSATDKCFCGRWLGVGQGLVRPLDALLNAAGTRAACNSLLSRPPTPRGGERPCFAHTRPSDPGSATTCDQSHAQQATCACGPGGRTSQRARPGGGCERGGTDNRRALCFGASRWLVRSAKGPHTPLGGRQQARASTCRLARAGGASKRPANSQGVAGTMGGHKSWAWSLVQQAGRALGPSIIWG